MAGGCFFWITSRLQADGTADRRRFSNTRDQVQNFAKDKFSEMQERERCIVRIAVLLLCCCAGPCQRNAGPVRWIFSCGLAIFVRADAFNLVKALGKIRQRAKTDLLCNLGQAEIRAGQQRFRLGNAAFHQVINGRSRIFLFKRPARWASARSLPMRRPARGMTPTPICSPAIPCLTRQRNKSNSPRALVSPKRPGAVFTI